MSELRLAPNAAAVSDGALRPLRHFVPGFLGRCLFREMSPATIESYGEALQSFLSFCDTHGLVSPRDVTPTAVEAFMVTLRHHQGLAVSTVNHRRYVLISFFRYLERDAIVTSNAARIADGLKVPRRLPDYIPSSQQVYLLEQLTKDRSPQGVRNLAVIGTGLLCGLRASELVSLRLPNLNLADGTLKVSQGKGRRDRFVPVIPWLERVLGLALARPAFLRGQRHSTDHVFLKRGGRPLTSRGLWHLVHRIVSPIVGRRIHPHVLRHSFASRALAGGGNVVALQKAMGHSQPTTTMIYTHLPDDLYVRQFTAWLSGEAPAPEAVAPLPDLPAPMPTLPIPPEPAGGVDNDPADGPPPRPSHPFADRRTRDILRERRRDRRGRHK